MEVPMRVDDAGVDTVIAQLAENETATHDGEGLVTDIVAFFDPEAATPSANDGEVRRHKRDRFRDRADESQNPPKR